MKNINYLVGFLLLVNATAFAQPSADFLIPSSACLDETFKISNLSQSIVKYEWDFCQGDLTAQPTAQNLGSALVASNSQRIKMVFDGVNWFGFAINRTNSTMLRLDFGSSIDNPLPSVVNLGNIGNAIDSPTDLDVVFESGNWYAFILGDNGSILTRIDFGSSLITPSNQLTVTTLLLGSPEPTYGGGIKVISDITPGEWYIVFTGINSISVARLTTIVSVPTPADIVSTGNVSPDFSHLSQMQIINSNGTWFGYTVSVANNKLYRLTFGSNLFAVPTYQDITGAWLGTSTPTGVGLGVDAGSYYLIVGTSGGLARVNLGTDLSLTPSGVFLGNLSMLQQINKLSLVKEKGNWRMFVCATFSSELFRISFPNMDCGNSISTQNEPLVRYNSSGIQGISLKAYYDAVNYIEINKTLNISSVNAPDILISNINRCVTSMIGFNYQSSHTLNSFLWIFGDTNTSTLPNPTHQYVSASDYAVSLQVTSSNGCNNLEIDTVNIYNEPISSFVLPPITPFCTNQEYTFTNMSTFDPGSNPTWEWKVNNVVVSSDEDLLQAFSSATAQEIKLIASIPGCENESTQTIGTVETGPLADFTFNGQCELADVQFTNTSIGSITSYAWDFDDGNNSPVENPTHIYSSPATYNVTLQTTNAAGCQNTRTESIPVYSKPQPDFYIDLPPFSCSGSPSQFNDLTPNPPDSNIDSWAWSFGDSANGSSMTRNPQYTYSLAGPYNVSLSVTTNFGCTNAVSKPIAIAPSPTANFTNATACVNQSTQFTDASAGSIISRSWVIGTTNYTTVNPTHNFLSSGGKTVLLTTTGSNNCVSSITKTITVPVPPVPNYSVQSNCATKPTIFTDTTPLGTDLPIMYTWTFGTAGTGSGSSSTFTFPGTGTQLVKMDVTNQSGCMYSITKSVVIQSPPRSIFIATPEGGGAPLPVSFTNTSTFATSYEWRFNDPLNTTSNSVSPSFTFDQLGEYVVDLVASNMYGCTDISSKTIQVVTPYYDWALEDFKFITNNQSGTIIPQVVIRNLSNLTINRTDLFLLLSPESLVKESINQSIAPGTLYTHTFSYELAPSNSLKFVCAEIRMSSDSDLSNNSRCIEFDDDLILLNPYPNPAVDVLNVNWISPVSGNATVVVFGPSGQKSLEFEKVMSEGLNQMVIDLEGIGPGLYVVVLYANQKRISRSFAIY